MNKHLTITIISAIAVFLGGAASAAEPGVVDTIYNIGDAKQKFIDKNRRDNIEAIKGVDNQPENTGGQRPPTEAEKAAWGRERADKIKIKEHTESNLKKLVDEAERVRLRAVQELLENPTATNKAGAKAIKNELNQLVEALNKTRHAIDSLEGRPPRDNFEPWSTESTIEEARRRNRILAGEAGRTASENAGEAGREGARGAGREGGREGASEAGREGGHEAGRGSAQSAGREGGREAGHEHHHMGGVCH